MLGVAAVGGCLSFRAIWCAIINKSLFVNKLVRAEIRRRAFGQIPPKL